MQAPAKWEQWLLDKVFGAGEGMRGEGGCVAASRACQEYVLVCKGSGPSAAALPPAFIRAIAHHTPRPAGPVPLGSALGVSLAAMVAWLHCAPLFEPLC